MACGISIDATATSTVLLLLVLLQAVLVWEETRGAPAKKSDILAGTEFLSVFINGAMAPTPQRRRGFRRGGHHAASSAGDSATAESHQHEASIYRISRNPSGSRPISVSRSQTSGREEVVRFYPISQRTLENRQQNLASLIDDLSTSGGISSTRLTPSSVITTTTTTTTTTMTSAPPSAMQERTISRSNGTSVGSGSANKNVSRQKVIGVSVTSTVEATPYKVRVEHYDSADAAIVTRPPSLESSIGREVTEEPARDSTRSTTRGPSRLSMPTTTTMTTTTTTTATTTMRTTTPPARFVTDELNNIVSESNRNEFSVDEDSPRTSWRGHVTMTPRVQTPTFAENRRDEEANETTRVIDVDAIILPKENNDYELQNPVQNSERRELNEELPETSDRLQGRKMGRHFDTAFYNRSSQKAYNQPAKVYKPARIFNEPAKVYSEPAKVYGEPEKVYGEPAKVYSEPAKVYSEPAKVYSEPAKIYGEPEKVYSEPSKIYSEPAKVYSEPAKIYSQPAKMYGEPSKIYNSEGQPVDRQSSEPDEQNYEIDESVSVGSNGNVHGPQLVVTEETPGASEVEDGHKVGYVVEGRNYRKYRVEERTPDGFIVGEYGVVSHDDGSLRGVRYTADGTINPQLIYDALMKFLAL